MHAAKSCFGRRAQPHRITVAHGEKVRTFSVPAWALWAGVGAAFSIFAWLAGTTVYIALHDEIYAAAKAHRITVERAYEDRIAALRRQIDQINTRQFLDEQAFENRLDTLLRKQAALEERHQQLTGLFAAARERKLTLEIAPSASQQAEGGAAGAYGLFTTAANASGFDPSRPAPLDQAGNPEPAPQRNSGEPSINRIDTSIARVEDLQNAMLSSLEVAISGLSDRLVEVSGAVGADLPEGALDGGLGGPLVELRRLETDDQADRRIERILEELSRFDVLRAHVDHLPVRAPLSGTLQFTSAYGTRLDPFLKRPALHTGVDFRAATGTPVHATADGLVTIAGYSGGYGRLVEIDHGNGYRTRYGHLSRIDVAPGERVDSGEVVGLVGSSGRSTGPHLHYETRVKDYARDPKPFVEAAQLVPEGF